MDVSILTKDFEKHLNTKVTLKGWIRNHRKQKEIGFLDLNDGTHINAAQIVYCNTCANFDEIQKFNIGSTVEVNGVVVASKNAGNSFEIEADEIILLSMAAADYPIQPKRHSMEFLREQAYLRPRTNLFQAVFRVRNAAAMAIHTFLQDRNFIYVNTPIFTDSDCEGAGEMFQATTLDLKKIPKNEDGSVDYSGDFFGKRVGLTVSGQMEGEAFAMAFRKIYTFGPTFRAENSNTKIHASEFWQIEPEIAFCNLQELMDLEEEMLKFIISEVLRKCPYEMEFLNKFVKKGLLDQLAKMVESKSVRLTHKETVEILKKSGKKWEFEPNQGEDIAKEHERYLTDELYNSPVFITDWPKDIKSFYMKLNDDGETVAACDYIVPGGGELMGGSQREDDIDKLLNAMDARKMNGQDIQWYVNLRKYGSCEHSGFGMGFERLLIYLTGVENIRDVIPFPRTPNNCLF